MSAPELPVKTIVVCLSRDRSFFSWFTYFTDGGGFTHASIAFDEDAEHYYSFNFRGFKREYITSLKKRPRDMKRYKIVVTEEQYEELKRILTEMESEKGKYKYDRAGAMLCLLKLPNNANGEEKLFCSQFVSKVLDESGCMHIKKSFGEITPNMLSRELEESGRVSEIEDDSTLTTFTDRAAARAIKGMEKGRDVFVNFSMKKIARDEGHGKYYPPFLVKLGIGSAKTGMVVFKAAAKVTRKTTGFAGKIPEHVAKQTDRVIKITSKPLGIFIGRKEK